MREIDSEQVESIRDIFPELAYRGFTIAPSAIEKDYHVTAALSALSQVDNEHFKLVFAGGTSLSKAHSIIERFSEDVDIKVIKKNPSEVLGKDTEKKILSNLKTEVSKSLEINGFTGNSIEIDAKNRNMYIVMNIAYKAKFEQASSLRQAIQLELVRSELQTPPQTKSFSTLSSKLGFSKDPVVVMECSSIAETLAEKLVSFPRRLAKHLQTGDNSLDQTLVRHLFDAYCISKSADFIAETGGESSLIKMVANVIEKDRDQFKTQHSDFFENPQASMLLAMDFCKKSPEMRKNYELFLKEMVFSPHKSDIGYAKALTNFSKLLETFVTGYSKGIDYLSASNKTKLKSASMSEAIKSTLKKDDTGLDFN